MTKTNRHRIQPRRVLFVRVGWMHFYNGPVPVDERPVGGGRYNKTKIGHEVYNFRETGAYLYGYFQPTMSSQMVALERIDPSACACGLHCTSPRRRASRRWLVSGRRGAPYARQTSSPGKPRGYGHFCSARRNKCVLLLMRIEPMKSLSVRMEWGNRMFAIPWLQMAL
jgi:hypothetical protein